jgi:hypothetical protein
VITLLFSHTRKSIPPETRHEARQKRANFYFLATMHGSNLVIMVLSSTLAVPTSFKRFSTHTSTFFVKPGIKLEYAIFNGLSITVQ